MALGILALLLINAVLFVASSLLLPKPKTEGLKPSKPGEPGSEERPLPVVWGTVAVPANVTSFSHVAAREQTEKVKTGIFSSHKITVGYTYEALVQVALCHGPVDALIDLVWNDSVGIADGATRTMLGVNEDGVWVPFTVDENYTDPALPLAPGVLPVAGSLVKVDATEALGGYRHGGGLAGWFRFYYGTTPQTADPALLAEWGEVSDYEGVCHLVLGRMNGEAFETFAFGETGTMPPLAVVVRRCPSHLGLAAELTNLNGGANGAEIIYEILTNTVWGLGLDPSLIDVDSFVAAATALAAENLGLNLSLAAETGAEDAITEVCRYLDGQVQQHPVTGLLELTLNRADYDVGDLPVFSPANAHCELHRPSWTQLVNQVKVTYTERQGPVFRDRTVGPIDDLAAQRNFGIVHSLTVPFLGVHDPVVAEQLAIRSLRLAGLPLAKGTLVANRLAADFRTGRPFVLHWPAYGVEQHVFRAVRVDYGTRTDGKVTVDFVEDIFALDEPFYAIPADPPPAWIGAGKGGPLTVDITTTTDGEYGYLVLTFTGGGGAVTAVQFSEQRDNDPPADWHDNVSPADFSTFVELDDTHRSKIAWRVRGLLKTGAEGTLAEGEVDFDPAVLPAISDFKWTDSEDGLTRTFRFNVNSVTDKAFIYDVLAEQGAPDPWPAVDLDDDEIDDAERLPDATEDPVEGVVTYTVEKPPAGWQRFLQFEPRRASLRSGHVRRAVVDPAGTKEGATIHVAVTNGTADLAVQLHVATSQYPVTMELFEGRPSGVPIAEYVFTTSRTIDGDDVPALNGRALPLRELLAWYARFTDVSGFRFWAYGSGDRDALAAASLTVQDYRAAPRLVVNYDDDTDAVRITTPDGVITYTGLAGSGTIIYTVGDVLDNDEVEDAYVVDEERGPYLVEAEGGGVWTTIGEPLTLHGQPSNPPTVKPRVVLDATGETASVFAELGSDVAEKVRLFMREDEDVDAPVYGLVAGAGDDTPLFVTDGTEVGPANFFSDGVSSPEAKLAGIALVRDQLKRIWLQAIGEDSGVRSLWIPVPLNMKDQPWLESVSLTFDELTATLRLRAIGGAKCQSAFFEVADNTDFTGPDTFASALLDGGDVTAEFPLAGAQVGKAWYGRVTPYNRPLVMGAPTGLPGEGQVVELFVKAVLTFRIETSEPTVGGGRMDVVVDDPSDELAAVDPVQFEVTVLGATTTEDPTAVIGATYRFAFTLDPDHPTTVAAVLTKASGVILRPTPATFDWDKLSNCRLVVAPSGGVASVTAQFDTDTVVGIDAAELRIDGGSWEPLDVAADRTGRFDIILDGDSHELEVRGYDGAARAGRSAFATIPELGAGGGGMFYFTDFSVAPNDATDDIDVTCDFENVPAGTTFTLMGKLSSEPDTSYAELGSAAAATTFSAPFGYAIGIDVDSETHDWDFVLLASAGISEIGATAPVTEPVTYTPL